MKYPKDERLIFEGVADVLRADSQLRLCLIVRTKLPSGESWSTTDEPPDIDEVKLADKWKVELTEKVGIKDSRIFILNAGAHEYNGGVIEVWVVPPGASLPDPHKSDEESAPDRFILGRANRP